EDPPGALGAALQRLLVPVDDPLRHAELRPAVDRRLLEVQGRHHRRVPHQQQLDRLVVHEGAVLQGVVAGLEGVLDALGGPAVAGRCPVSSMAGWGAGATPACISSKVMHGVWWSLVWGAAASPVG